MTQLQEKAAALKKTPLYDRHLRLGAKMADFGGWSMPIYYSSILEEHRATRRSCGVFDVSHLGEFHVKGPGAFEFLQRRLTSDLAKLSDKRIGYNLLCDENGLMLDDILVYRESKDDYFLIVNAASIASDFEALAVHLPPSVEMKNLSDETACVAIQGPEAERLLRELFGFDLSALGYYAFKEEAFEGRPVWVSRSGYTGEDGFEIFSDNRQILVVWDRLIGAREKGALPAGLGARNTLRLEAGNALYGNDADRTTTPLEAGLGWAVSFDKGDFVGREALLKQKTAGLARRLVGFRLLDKPIAREHYPILKDGRRIGEVTSGSFSPTLGYNIGMGYVEKAAAEAGTRIQIEVHGRPVDAEVVKRPFIPLRHKK